MKKTALLTSGTVLLLGGLFYVLSSSNPHPPVPTVPGPTNPPSALPLKSGTLDRVIRNEASGETDRAATSSTDMESTSRPTGGKQESVMQTSPKSVLTKSESPNARPAVSKDKLSPSEPPIGIRLAPDVRLPVAAMPPIFKITSVQKKVLDQIVMDYYRDLASPPSPLDQNGSNNDSTVGIIEKSENGELTRVITNNPAVEAARERADYRYKAIFGHKAYNLMTTRTLMEARTPVTPGE